MPSFMIGIEDVLEARTASSASTTLSSSAEHLGLELLVLDDRLDDELTVGELAVVGGHPHATERRVAFGLVELAAARRRGRATR